jgi:tetratricopeptide (TPR) repeat protein
MAECFTCGTYVNDSSFSCPVCENSEELEHLRKELRDAKGDLSERIDYLEGIVGEGLRALAEAFSGMASAMEWGFQELSWQLQQQTDVIRSIDHTLKTPDQTHANELRQMADELRRRGVLNKAEKFYLDALKLNPLDYRIYIGLVWTYLRENKFADAKAILEGSLPHAPKKGGLDYKSYTYRLIGRIHYCEGNYTQAVYNLQLAAQLSPSYVVSLYDLAQYCARIGDKKGALPLLKEVILAKPRFWYLASKEQNFNPIRNEVVKLLEDIKEDAFRKAKDVVNQAERSLNSANEKASKVIEEMEKLIEKGKLHFTDAGSMLTECKTTYQDAHGKVESALRNARNKLSLGDYIAFLEARQIAESSDVYRAIGKVEDVPSVSKRVESQIHVDLKKLRAEKIKFGLTLPIRAVIAFVGLPLAGAICGFVILLVVGILLLLFGINLKGDIYWFLFVGSGVLAGLALGTFWFVREFKKKKVKNQLTDFLKV